jgi:hypothetical protein
MKKTTLHLWFISLAVFFAASPATADWINLSGAHSAANIAEIYVELVYPFETKPREITFVPPLEAGGKTAASIGFIAYHKGVPIVDYRYLSEPAMLSLDWQDPWYSRFENKALQRWQQSGIKTFLYRHGRRDCHLPDQGNCSKGHGGLGPVFGQDSKSAHHCRGPGRTVPLLRDPR